MHLLIPKGCHFYRNKRALIFNNPEGVLLFHPSGVFKKTEIHFFYNNISLSGFYTSRRVGLCIVADYLLPVIGNRQQLTGN